MRLFIAINFDKETKDTILAVQRRLREIGRGSFSRPDNLHLTLAFLGEIEPRRVEEVREAMDAVRVPSLELQFTHIGCFRRDGGDIWWLGLAPNDGLLELQKDLSDRLRAKGFPLENRRFSPHITLARRFSLEETLDKNALMGSPFCTCVDTISLMQSERLNGTLTYSEIYYNEGRNRFGMN